MYLDAAPWLCRAMMRTCEVDGCGREAVEQIEGQWLCGLHAHAHE